MNEPSRVSDRPLVSHCRSLPFPVGRSFTRFFVSLRLSLHLTHFSRRYGGKGEAGTREAEDVTSGRKTDGSGHECSRYATPLAPFLRPSAHPRLPARKERSTRGERKETSVRRTVTSRTRGERYDRRAFIHSVTPARRSSLASLPTPRPVLMSVSRAHYVPPSFPPHGRDTEWRVEEVGRRTRGTYRETETDMKGRRKDESREP